MSYQITHFDSVPLPLANLKQERGTPEAVSTIRRYVGGVLDYAGANPVYPDAAQIALSGIYYGESGYLTRQNTAIVTDNSGNRLSVGSAPNRLRVQLDELSAKVGRRGQLWRLLETGDRQWKYARLLRFTREAKTDERLIRAEVKLLFETIYGAWRSAAMVTASGTAPGSLIASAGGNVTILDPVLAITAGGTIGRLTITGNGIALLWTGTLTTGQTLRIDAGLRTVRIGASTNAYSGFSLQSGHTRDRWLELDQGLNTLYVRTDGAAATLSLTYYDQWQ